MPKLVLDVEIRMQLEVELPESDIEDFYDKFDGKGCLTTSELPSYLSSPFERLLPEAMNQADDIEIVDAWET